MNYNKINKLLQSTDIEDVKLGVILFCQNNTCEEIVKKFTNLRNNIYLDTIRILIPEHPIIGEGISVFITNKSFGICSTTKNPIEGEIF